MKEIGIEVGGPEAEGIEAAVKEIKLIIVYQTRQGHLYTTWDILDIFCTVGDNQTNTPVTSQKHRSQVRVTNLNMSLGNTNRLGECNP